MTQLAFVFDSLPRRFEIPFAAMSWVEDGQVQRQIVYAHSVDYDWPIWRMP